MKKDVKSKSWCRLLGEELLAWGRTGAGEARKMGESTVSVGGELMTGQTRAFHADTRMDLLHMTKEQRKRHGR